MKRSPMFVLTAARLTTWKRREQVGVMTPNSMEMWGSQPSTRMPRMRWVPPGRGPELLACPRPS
ncbi:MAG: hypothetical protein E5Y41_00710 [Mesorhizobium sp.]|nr:MAG: hypothetical protein E5Y41_00710 [Mesorhizobium sp.]